jgi:ribosomal protein S18 acetylase RimI-like enzyme
MSIRIHDAQAADIQEIVALIGEFAMESKEASPITASFVQRYLESSREHLLLAEWDSRAAGLLSYSLRLDLWHAGPCCLITQLFVRQPYRGKGIGSEMINHMLRKAEAEGYREISLTVEKENIRAKALYRRLGINEEVVGLEKHLAS